MTWMILPLRRYAEFHGRSRRLEFWMYALFNLLVIIGLVWIPIGWASINNPGTAVFPDTSPNDGDFNAAMIPLLLWIAATIVPNIALVVRRLHDQDKSGWLYLITVIPYIGWVFLLIFGCIDGTPGENQYGDDPKGGSPGDIFE